MNTKRLICFTAHDAFNIGERIWGPLQKLELKRVMDMAYACDPGELVYAERLGKSYSELQSGHPTVFVLAYCFYAAFYGHLQFLTYLKLWRATIKFMCKNWSDKWRTFFLGWYNLEFYSVLKEDRLRFYIGVPGWWGFFNPY